MGQKAGSLYNIKNKGHEKNGKYLISWGHLTTFLGVQKKKEIKYKAQKKEIKYKRALHLGIGWLYIVHSWSSTPNLFQYTNILLNIFRNYS